MRVFSILILWVIPAYVYCFFDPRPTWAKAVRIDTATVDQALPWRLRAWHKYALDLDYFVDGDRPDSLCSYDGGPLPLLNRDNVLVHGIENIEICIAHEVGHHIDRKLGRVSESDGFRRAVALTIILVADLPEGTYHWRWKGEMVANYPGINGNPMIGDDKDWGGYHELYADLHEVDYLIQIPPPLQVYFEDFFRGAGGTET